MLKQKLEIFLTRPRMFHLYHIAPYIATESSDAGNMQVVVDYLLNIKRYTFGVPHKLSFYVSLIVNIVTDTLYFPME